MKRKAASDPDWMKLALWVAKPHEWREDREDVRQEALLGAWRSVQKTQGLGRCSEQQAAVKGARWAVSEYLRRAAGGSRCLQIPCLSLEALREEGDASLPLAPDPTGPALERLDLWGRAARVLTGEEYEILWRLHALQEEQQEIGIDENAEAASLPHWPQITASRLREVARLCLAQCFILEQKEDRHVKV